MKFGVYVSPCGPFADARLHGELAMDAEAAGWHGYFLWDHISMASTDPVVDPWIALTCVALNTERIQLGPLITPLARRRPAKLARETVSLDHLCGGRMVLGVGLGDIPQELDDLGETADPRARGAQLDEALQVLTALWSGEPITHAGPFYTVRGVALTPPPRQSPRIPVWVAGFWPRRAPFRRAARWDGMFAGVLGAGGDSPTPNDLREMLAFVHTLRDPTQPFDVVVAGVTAGADLTTSRATVRPYEGVATWWLEHIHQWRGSLEDMRQRIRQGPPA